MAPQPYEGQEGYIFISYAHRDKDQVFRVLERLQEQGYRFWFDDGIAPGSEWPEDIARHLDQAAMVIAFVTPLSMSSTNCRREINFALSREKPFLSVILEPTQMPLGMELQLSSQRSVIRHNYPTWESFAEKILACPTLAPCRIPDRERDPAAPAKTEAEPTPAPVPAPAAESAPVPASPPAREAELVPPQETKTAAEPPPPRRGKKNRSAGKEKPAEKKPFFKRLAFWIPAVIVALLLLLILLPGGGSGTEEKGFSWGSVQITNGHVFVSGKTFTQQDLRKLAALSELNSFSLTNCDLSACDLEGLRFASSGLKSVEIKDCSGVDDFGFLEGQPLERLTLEGCAAFTDLSKLDCGKIYSLHLAGTGVSDLSPLRGAPLNTVDISDTAVSDLSPLADSPNLGVLTAENCPIASVDVLAGLTRLTDLDFSGCPIEAVTEEFQSLSLTRLRMANCGAKDLSGFANATTLRVLDLSGNPELTDLDWLHEKNCGTLETLNLSYTGLQAEDLAFLSGCASVKELSLSGIELENLDFCASMTGLRVIRAEGCGLRDISKLPASGLDRVLLAYNRIEDIGCLAALSMESRPFIDLSFNSLEDVSALPEGKYSVLLLCGNEDGLPATLPAKVEGNTLALSWSKDIQKKLTVPKGSFSRVFLTDCPATEVLDLQEALGKSTLKTVSGRELMELLAAGEVSTVFQESYTALLPLYGGAAS